ncbi:MAG: alpha/beta hydrolase [Bacteroidota bacterium]
MDKNIYILSGLGADERVFQKLDFGEYTPRFIQWTEPLKKESISAYATRLLEQIDTKNPILLGLSFGGMMAIEISKLIPCKQLILLSSAKNRFEIPFYYRWIGKLNLHKLVPASLLKWPNSFSNWFFGAHSALEKHLLKLILIETSPNYLKWAVDQVLNWENTYLPPDLVHIHGDKDHVLPVRYVQCDIRIKDGGHFMLLNKAKEISGIIQHLLQKPGI